MYQFNLKNLQVFTAGSKHDWVEKIVNIQEDVKDMSLDRVGGFAIHKDLLSNMPIRMVLPNRIWVFKAWKIDSTEVKKMIFKGLNIKLFSDDINLASDKEYVLLKPLYEARNGCFDTYDHKDKCDVVEYKQPFYVIDVTEKDYVVFFEMFDFIATATLGEIYRYNEQSGAYLSDAKRNYKMMYSEDRKKAILLATNDSEQYCNAPQLLIGVRPTSCIVNIGEPSFAIKKANELTDLDYEAYADSSLILPPRVTRAGEDWMLGWTH